MNRDDWQLVIRPDGRIEFADCDALGAAYGDAGGQLTRRRASHVEPVGRVARALFRAIRRRVADRSAAAAFTRVWPVRWRVAIVDGPVLGVFNKRSDAIAAELAWLNNNLL